MVGFTIKSLCLYKIFIIYLLLVIASCSKNDISLPCLPSDLGKNVLVYYPFSNGILNNIISPTNHLINMNKVRFTEDRDNHPNCAVLFDKNYNQYLTTDAIFFNEYQSKSFSISLWYKPLDEKSDFELLIGRSDSGISCPDKHGEWSVGLYDCRRAVASINKKSIWSETDTIWLNQNISGPQKCEIEIKNNTSLWKHLVFTYKNESRKLYINGILQKTVQSNECGDISENIGDLIIGKYYTGCIDDVIIFNKELTFKEVSEIYNSESCCY